MSGQFKHLHRPMTQEEKLGTKHSKTKALHHSMAKSKGSGKTKYYVGHSNTPHKREVFGSKTEPTKESHPQYGHVRSGFKSKKDAESKKDYY